MSELQELFDAGNADELLRIGTEKFRDGEEAVAFSYYRAACKLGNAVAMGNLGYCYQTGRGVKADERLALYCFERAAEQDDAGCLMKVGDFHYNGKGGLPRNRSHAFGCYLRGYEIAANASEPDIMLTAELCYRLGFCKKDGLGTEQNLQDAYEYFQAVAELVCDEADQGNARALTLLEKCQNHMDYCESRFE
ncbi:MAG: sel1 repeat family protein [Clostridia bacterium]|nr:sel1 repeat family protein [Clostridia bacterium]